MAVIKMWILRIIGLITRYPGLIAIFGFVSGVASFLLVEREQEKFAQMLSALMLVSWVWLTLENLLQRSVSSWFGVKLPPPLLSFATQLVHQESLFFVIPFFFITTTWNSGQMVFTSLLIVSAIVSIVDPIYYRWLAARRWLYFIFHGLTLFAVLLTALPIIFHLPTPKSYLLSLIIAVLLSLPGIIRALSFNWWKRSFIALFLIVVVGGIGVLVRTWIPPATLWLTNVAITERIDDESRSPENTLNFVTVEQLRTGLYAYTAIRAPRGLNERIYHVWRLNGTEVDRIALDINGGREAGYRAWTHKINFPPYPTGRWQIHVVTEANQVIGVLRFQVVKSSEPAQPINSSSSQTSENFQDIDDNADNEQREITPENSIESPTESSTESPTENPAEKYLEDESVEEKQLPEEQDKAVEDEQSSSAEAQDPAPVIEQPPVPEVEEEAAPDVEDVVVPVDSASEPIE